MKYAGLIKQSLVDYPGEIAAVLFTRGCNFRCPFCHNVHLLAEEKREPGAESSLQAGGEKDNNGDGKTYDIESILEFLRERKGFLDAVVISGGEPTLHPELAQDLRRIKEIGYLIKLDSNGSNPELLAYLLQEKLLDYVAMDIKAPLDFKKYLQASGRLSSRQFFNIRNSINLLQNARIAVEFRTTVVPLLHSPEDIRSIAQYIEGARLYSLQQFNPTCTLAPSYEAIVPFSPEEMQEIAELCRPYVKIVRVVNI